MLFLLDIEVNCVKDAMTKGELAPEAFATFLVPPLATTDFFTLHTQISFLPTQEGGMRA